MNWMNRFSPFPAQRAAQAFEDERYGEAVRLYIQAGDEQGAARALQRYLPCLYSTRRSRGARGKRNMDFTGWPHDQVSEEISLPLYSAILSLIKLQKGIDLARQHRVAETMLAKFTQQVQTGLTATLDAADKVVGFELMGFDYDNVQPVLISKGIALSELSKACSQSQTALASLMLSGWNKDALGRAEQELSALAGAVRVVYQGQI